VGCRSRREPTTAPRTTRQAHPGIEWSRVGQTPRVLSAHPDRDDQIVTPPKSRCISSSSAVSARGSRHSAREHLHFLQERRPDHHRTPASSPQCISAEPDHHRTPTSSPRCISTQSYKNLPNADGRGAAAVHPWRQPMHPVPPSSGKQRWGGPRTPLIAVEVTAAVQPSL
jgi:hypothetical protein